MQEMTPLEEKEVRGLSFKLLLTLVIATASIVGTVMGTYFSMINKMEQIQLQNASDGKLNDLRIQNIENSIQLIQAQVDKLKDDMQEQK